MMSRAIVVPLSAAAVAWPQDSVTRLLQTLREEIKTDQAVRDVQTIWETDRWFTFPKFEETARNVAAIMRRAGLEDVEIRNPPADGVTQAGYWTMPLAWDVKVATLEIVEPEVAADMRVLADYQKVPTSVVMWSGPTPKGGVVTEVVLPSGNLAGMDLKGKLVLGARGAKTALAKAGALGLISENTETPTWWMSAAGSIPSAITAGALPRGAHLERVDYAVDRESQAVRSAAELKEGLADLASFARPQKARLESAVRDRAAAFGLGEVSPVAPPVNPEAEKSLFGENGLVQSLSTTCRTGSAKDIRARASGVYPCRRSTGAMEGGTWRRSFG